MCAKGLLWGRLTDSSKSTDSSSVFSQRLWQHRSAPKHIVIGCRFWQSEAQRHAGPTELRFFSPLIMFIFWTYPSTSSVCMCVKTLPSLSKMSQQQQHRRTRTRPGEEQPSQEFIASCRHSGASCSEDSVRAVRVQPRVSVLHDFHAAAGRGRGRGKTPTSMKRWKLGGRFLPEGFITWGN